MSDPVKPSSLSQTREQLRTVSAAIAAALAYLEPAQGEPTCWVAPKTDYVVVYVLAGGVLHRFGGKRDPPITPGHETEPRESACDGRVIPLRDATFEMFVSAKVVPQFTVDLVGQVVGDEQHGDTVRMWTFHLPGEPPLICTSADRRSLTRQAMCDETAFAEALAAAIAAA
jgi:hypothetical protein